jgi:methyltransferase family protein
MAIGGAAIELLVKLQSKGYLKPGGAIAEVGAQQISRSALSAPDRIEYLGSLFGIDRPLPFGPLSSGSSELNSDWDILTAPFAREFWIWLGFEYAAIDIDNSPDSIPLDLNFDAVPASAKGNYNLVTNFGTTEHVANQLNAFKIVHDLTAHNGIMIHEVPAQGMFNHGIVNYNFKFFWLLARSNGYEIIHADFMSAEDQSNFPENIEEFLDASKLAASRPAHDYKVADAGWLVVLQKSLNMEFVPPIDVVTGTPTDISVLKERYWTVFDPDRFEEFSARALATESQSQAAIAPLGEEKRQSTSQSPSTDLGSSGVIMRLFRIMKRLVRNSDSSALHLTQVADNTAATTAGIANQADMIRLKLDALTRVMYELREIQKAQLAMQRQAADMIRQLATAPPKSPSNDK